MLIFTKNKKVYFPGSIEIELTNQCNLNCIMCPNFNKRQARGYMADDLITAILDETLKYPSRQYSLHGLGEPLLHPKCLETVERIKQTPDSDNTIYLTTNGHFLTEAVVSELIRLNVDFLNISIGAATGETYRKVRGSIYFDLVVSQVLKALELKAQNKSRIQISVQIIETGAACGEIDAFVSFWKNYDVSIEIWRDFQKGPYLADRSTGTSDKSRCRYVKRYVLVTWQGEMIICCQDVERKHSLGKLRDADIRTLFNNPQAAKYRRLLKNGKANQIDICKDCIYYDDALYRKVIKGSNSQQQ